jgi:hypothetical protein
MLFATRAVNGGVSHSLSLFPYWVVIKQMKCDCAQLSIITNWQVSRYNAILQLANEWMRDTLNTLALAKKCVLALGEWNLSARNSNWRNSVCVWVLPRISRLYEMSLELWMKDTAKTCFRRERERVTRIVFVPLDDQTCHHYLTAISLSNLSALIAYALTVKCNNSISFER